MEKTVKLITLKAAAKILISDEVDETANFEYVRGICELLADIDGRPDIDHGERACQIARELGMPESTIRTMYNY